jgi:MoaA/NifB/PqqE/SkfB family radical SAM enzyme
MMNSRSMHLSWLNVQRRLLMRPLYSLGIAVEKPTQVSIPLVHACNARCMQCAIWKHPRNPQEELSTQQCKQTIRNLRRVLGTYYLILTGGEPTLRDDLPDIIRFACRQGLVVGMNTNLLVDTAKLQKILDAGLDIINVSLDGARPGTHDTVRGRKGAFRTAMKNIAAVQASPCLLRVETVISSNNIGEIPALVNWARKTGVYDITFQTVVHSLGSHKAWRKEWKSRSPLWPKDKEQVSKAFDALMQMKQQGYRIANSVRQLDLMKSYFLGTPKAGKALCSSYWNAVVYPSGSLMLCKSMPPVGNVLKDDFSEAWSANARSTIAAIKRCSEQCSLLNCNFDEGVASKAGKLLRILSTTHRVSARRQLG